jgi:hypothetical protein
MKGISRPSRQLKAYPVPTVSMKYKTNLHIELFKKVHFKRNCCSGLEEKRAKELEIFP